MLGTVLMETAIPCAYLRRYVQVYGHNLSCPRRTMALKWHIQYTRYDNERGNRGRENAKMKGLPSTLCTNYPTIRINLSVAEHGTLSQSGF
jgi:hypothetical protein